MMLIAAAVAATAIAVTAGVVVVLAVSTIAIEMITVDTDGDWCGGMKGCMAQKMNFTNKTDG